MLGGLRSEAKTKLGCDLLLGSRTFSLFAGEVCERPAGWKQTATVPVSGSVDYLPLKWLLFDYWNTNSQ